MVRQGLQGVQGDPDDQGPQDAAGTPARHPAQVFSVASSGDNTFPLLSSALASITDNSALEPYVIKIAPGIYNETSTVVLKDHVDVEGSAPG